MTIGPAPVVERRLEHAVAGSSDNPKQPDPARSLRLHRDDGAASIPAESRELVLVKHGHRYVFRCEAGRESELLDRLVEMVQDPECELDWFDAAVLSHQLGQRMHAQIQALRKKSA